MSNDQPLSRRSFLKATGGIAGATTLAGCSTDDEPGTSTETPTDGDTTDTTATDDGPDIQKGGTLRLINATMTTLDPVAIGDTASGIVGNQCYEGLFRYKNGNPVAEPTLAASYETNDDFTQYTFTLKEGVQFHNGMGELSASDFAYSWERLAASDHSERAYFILDSMGVKAQNQQGEEYTGSGSYQPGSMDVEGDGLDLTLTLRRPFHATLEMLSYGNFAAHPEGIVGDIDGYDGDVEYKKLANNASYGTGPFKLQYWSGGEDAQVTKFDGFREDGKPYLDSIHWAIIEDPEPQYRYSTNGNADLLTIPTQYYAPDKVSVEETRNGKEFGTYGPIGSGQLSGQNVDYLRVPEMATYYIAFDVSNTPLAVRKAVAYAVNRDEINSSVFKSRLPSGYHITPPSIFPGGPEEYDAHVEENYPYGINETQIGEAKRVMEEAGYGPDNMYELTINSYVGIFSDMVRGLRDKLSAAHINASVQPTQFSQIIEKGKNGNLQMYTLGWIADWPAPDNFVQLMAPEFTDVQELGGSALTYVNWNHVDTEASQKAQDAWDTISNNLQPTEEAKQTRNEAYLKMEEANWEDVAFIHTSHGATERFYTDGIHMEPFGGLGISRQRHYTTWKEQ